jgi:hypothetical protein
MRARRAVLPAAVLCVLVLAGCGPPPPQAPPGEAARLDTALSGISTACGLADQITAFPPAPANQMAVLEATASTQATKLAGVFHRNPGWIYQGETVSRIVNDGIAMLGSCGLSQARRTLAEQTGR